jgi:hypothetical protein
LLGRFLKKLFTNSLVDDITQTIETGGYIIERERVTEKDYHGDKEVFYYSFGTSA